MIKIYFSAIIPLTPIAVEKVGPHNAAHDKTHDATHDKILAFCMTPHSKAEIAEYCNIKTQRILPTGICVRCLMLEALK